MIEIQNKYAAAQVLLKFISQKKRLNIRSFGTKTGKADLLNYERTLLESESF